MVTKNYFVAIYLGELAYGGSEEGGWWYDCGTREKDRRVWIFQNEDKACEFSAKLNDRLARWVNKNRREKSSVISDGVYEAHIWENELPDYFPQSRPHYE